MKSSFICLLFVIVFTGLKSWGAPDSFTYQGRILKVDGTPLEYNNVSFAFSITNQSGNCTFYQEQRNGVNMQGSGGVFDVPIGTGTRSFPTGPTASIQDAFKNSIDLPCAAGGTYKPAENETRILKVQFHDGSGWKAITPPSEIRSVPFASFSYSAARLGDSLPTDFVLKDNLASCAVGQYLTYNGTAFTCQNDSGGAGTISDINVSAPLVKGGTASIPTLSITVGTGAGSVAAGNDARFGDATKIQNVAVDATAPTANQVLKYNGTSSWVPSSLAIADVAGLSTQLTNKVDATMFPTSCTAGQSLVFVTPANKFDCYNIQITESQITGTIAGAKINGNIAGNAAGFTGALTGDVSGTQAATVVDKIKGVAIDATAPTTGQVLKFDGTKWAPAADTTNSGTITNVIAGTGLTGGGTSGAVTLNVDGSAVTNLNPANLSAAVPVNKGGTGQTTAAAGFNALSPLTTKGDILARDGTSSTRLGVGSNGQILAADSAETTGLKWITPNAGTVTTVSATAPLSVATGSSTPAISISAGTINGQTLRWDTGAWTANKLFYTDLLNVNSLSPWPTTDCTAGQALIWLSGSDSFACSTITVSGSNFAVQSANTFFAGPTTGSAAPAFRAIASSDLPVTGAGGIYTNGGNSFGVAASLGTNDNQSLTLKTNNSAKMTILPNGSVGIGTPTPDTKLVLDLGSTPLDGDQSVLKMKVAGDFGVIGGNVETSQAQIGFLGIDDFGGIGTGAAMYFKHTTPADLSSAGLPSGGHYIFRGTATNKDIVLMNGKVGIGKIYPNASLDVNGNLMLGDENVACSSTNVGAIRRNASTSIIETCRANRWIAMENSSAIPQGTTAVMTSCPTGWTQVGMFTLTTTATSYVCQADAAGANIPAGTEVFMESCPTGWTATGSAGIKFNAVSSYTFFRGRIAYQKCSTSVTATIPASARIISQATCPATMSQLPGFLGYIVGTTYGKLDTACAGAACVICSGNNQVGVNSIEGGYVGDSSNGLNTYVSGGLGGRTSGSGGIAYIYGGHPTEGHGGSVSIEGAPGITASATARNGGAVSIKGGASAAGGSAGAVNINGGTGNSSSGGNVMITSGSGTAGAGYVVINAGQNTTDSTYGHVLLNTSPLGGGVAIGINDPLTYRLRVNGSTRVEGTLSATGVTDFPSGIRVMGGNVSIGTTSPSANFHVIGSTLFQGGTFEIIGNPNIAGDVNVTGNITATGSITPSDLRLKRNISSLSHPLAKIMQLRGVTYDWRSEEFPERHFTDSRQLGVIAQEVEVQFPEAVVTRPDGFKGVNYSLLVAPLIEAVKELYAQFNQETANLKAENLRLRQENEDIKARLDRIEKQLNGAK
ncbi:tail fiber domain-containing protein [Bdellovibrio bacteriovorus]|uniref:tail fiber domain-containing protein n=1 Tax=Bdellovibrio bacteriovorus TaxID=959 RepID=UPI003AA7D0BA